MFTDTDLYPIQPVARPQKSLPYAYASNKAEELLHLGLAVRNSLSETGGPIPAGSRFIGSLTGSPFQLPSKSAGSPSKSSVSPSKPSGSPSKPCGSPTKALKPRTRRAMSTRGSGHISLPFTAANPPHRQSRSPDPLSTIVEVTESLDSGDETWDSIMDTSSGSSAEDSLAIDRYLQRYHQFPRIDDSLETSLVLLPTSVEASLDILPPELREGPVGDEFMAQLFGACE